MNLLAKSCFAPGLISMISNLISSCGDLDCKQINNNEWFSEYAAGMGMEIYCCKLEPKVYPDGIKFSKIAEIAYTEYSTIVFALEIQSKPLDGKIPSSIIRLNPVDFTFKYDDFSNYVYKLHMICDDADQAEKVESLEEMSDERYERVFTNIQGLDPQRCKEKKKNQPANTPNEIEDENKNLLKVSAKPEPAPKKDKDISGILKNNK